MTMQHRRLIVGFLALNLLVSTTGFSLHTIYCLCKGERMLELFAPDEATCQVATETAIPACHKAQADQPTCCQAKEVMACQAGPEKPSKGCCQQHESHFVKLDAKFVPGAVTKVLLAPLVCVLPTVDRSFLFIDHISTPTILPDNHAPPRPSGRDWLALGQIYRC